MPWLIQYFLEWRKKSLKENLWFKKENNEITHLLLLFFKKSILCLFTQIQILLGTIDHDWSYSYLKWIKYFVKVFLLFQKNRKPYSTINFIILITALIKTLYKQWFYWLHLPWFTSFVFDFPSHSFTLKIFKK